MSYSKKLSWGLTHTEMPTNANVPPLDSFEHEHNVAERHVPGFDDRLSSVLNPPKGQDRIACEQYDTHTWAPGGSGTRRSGCGPTSGPVPSESAARVPQKL